MDLLLEQNITKIEDTKLLAVKLARLFQESDVIVFNGNLGSGKTTLVKYICRHYNITDVKSPSFSIVNEYIGDKKVYHFDFYRLKKIEELYDIGFEDYLNDTHAVIFIEWGNLMPDIIPESHYEVLIKITTGDERNVKIRKHGFSN